MKINKGRMTDREIMYIVENSTKKTAAEIAKALERKPETIQAIGEKIGVTFKGSK